MKPREVLLTITLALVLLAAPLVADAQQPGKVPTIGYLSQWCSSAEPPCLNIPAFLEGLKELGYVDGKNIAIEYRFTEGRLDRIPELAAELVRLKVDIIVTETAAAALRVRKATQTIPIVMGSSGDPVSLGLVASLAHPGGNVTGLSDMASGLKERSLQLLTEVVPKLTRVGVLWDGVKNRLSDGEWAEVRAVAQPLNIQLYSLEARGPADLPAVFAEAARQQVQAVLMFGVPDLVGGGAGAQTAELALQNRLPMISGSPTLTRQGGLMCYGSNILAQERFRRAATFVDRILKGANPADLPVEQPTKFVLWVNLKTAKALGLTIPQSVLKQAHQVIE